MYINCSQIHDFQQITYVKWSMLFFVDANHQCLILQNQVEKIRNRASQHRLMLAMTLMTTDCVSLMETRRSKQIERFSLFKLLPDGISGDRCHFDLQRVLL
jgi:hypothetical protein